MTECDNSKIHTSSNFLLSICLLIMLDTLLLVPSLHCNTSLHFTTLHQTTLHYTYRHYFLPFTLHYPLIWLNPFTFPIALFHLTSLNQTQYSSPVSTLISKIMNHHFTPLHFLFIYLFTYRINPSLHLISLCCLLSHYETVKKQLLDIQCGL